MLTFVGVGPGDPELMTLKAVRALREADAVAVADRGAALGIVRAYIEGKPLLRLELPMRGKREDWEAAHARAAEQLLDWLSRYPRVAFAVLGDPGVYATSSYLMRRIRPRHPCEAIPGVPSVCAAAAALGVPLCEQGERLTIVDRVESPLPEGNLAVMKAGRDLDALRASAGGRKVYIARNLGMEGEWLGEAERAPQAPFAYFTTALLLKDREK